MDKYYYTPGTYEDGLNKLFSNNKVKYNVTQVTEDSNFNNNYTSTILSVIYDATTISKPISQEEPTTTTTTTTSTTTSTASTTLFTTTETTTILPVTEPTTILTTVSEFYTNLTDYFDSPDQEFTTGFPNTTITPVLFAGPSASELAQLFVLLLILLLILISASANSLTLHILINNATLSISKHYTNLTILCLTLANLSTAVFVGVPYLVKSLYTCKIQTYFKDVNQIGVLWTLFAIFVDRAIVHLNPNYKWVSRKRFGSILLFIWLHALLVSFFSNYDLFTTDKGPCPSEKEQSTFGYVTQIIYLYSLPISCTLSIIFVLMYTEFVREKPITPGINDDIIWEITSRNRPIHNLFNARPDLPRVMTVPPSNSTQPNQVLICYILVTIIYYILHIPNAVMFLGGSHLRDSSSLPAVVSVANLVSTTVNPIIYFCLRKDFKTAYTNAVAWEEDLDRVRRDSD